MDSIVVVEFNFLSRDVAEIERKWKAKMVFACIVKLEIDVLRNGRVKEIFHFFESECLAPGESKRRRRWWPTKINLSGNNPCAQTQIHRVSPVLNHPCL